MMSQPATSYRSALEVLRSSVNASIEEVASELGFSVGFLRRVEDGTWPALGHTLVGNMVSAYAVFVSKRAAVDSIR